MIIVFRRCCLIVLLIVGILNFFAVIAQKQDDKNRPSQAAPQDAGKTNPDQVLVSIIATDQTDSYVSDIRKEEFGVYEEGVKQPITFFAEVKEPFHIALLVDTSLSINPEDLRRVKMAARELLEQLRGSDLVSVISFNDSVTEGCSFTGDHGLLRNAINAIPAGGGTKLYDAMAFALDSLKRAKAKRSAIIILTDGVDWRSDSATFESNIAGLEESGVTVYPVLYNNRSQVEAMFRRQKTPDLDAVLGVRGIGSVSQTTAAGENPATTQKPGQSGQSDQNAPYKLPVPTGKLPPMGRDRNPNGGGLPDPNGPGQPDTRRAPDPRDYPDKTRSASNDPNVSKAPKPPAPAIGNSSTLDDVYKTADQYLAKLAEATGGELHRTERVPDLPDIFQRIVADLRHQYLLGYYPANAARDGNYRKIKVQTTRKDVVIRARPGYRASSAKP